MEQRYKWSFHKTEHLPREKQRRKKKMALIYRARLRNPLLLSMSFLPRLHISNPSSQSCISFSRKQPGFRYSVRSISEAAANPMVSRKEDENQSPQNWKIKMLYDGDCPLCMREVNMLRERNNSYGTIKFVDISSDDYSPEENQGLDYETVMGRIHAILSDGTIVRDVEAFRRLYEEVGLGWVYAVTKYEPISKFVDAIYAIWAKYRLQITGRPPLDDILLKRKKNKGEVCKDNNACKM